MKLRIAAFAALTLAAITLLAGCNKAASNANNTNSSNSNTGAPKSPSPTDGAQPSPTATSTGSSTSTPTAAFKAYYEAIKEKDTDDLKHLFSKATMSMMEAQAKQTNKQLDDVLKEGLEEASKEVPETLPETRNEKIDGETATLEVKDDKKDKWETLHFVREDGDWKISFER